MKKTITEQLYIPTKALEYLYYGTDDNGKLTESEKEFWSKFMENRQMDTPFEADTNPCWTPDVAPDTSEKCHVTWCTFNVTLPADSIKSSSIPALEDDIARINKEISEETDIDDDCISTYIDEDSGKFIVDILDFDDKHDMDIIYSLLTRHGVSISPGAVERGDGTWHGRDCLLLSVSLQIIK